MATDLPAPFNLQAVKVNNSVALSWEWQPPEPAPAFDTFGFEVLRDSQTLAVVDKTAYTDFAIPVGTHTYTTRVRSTVEGERQNVTHLSEMSEPVEVIITSLCSSPPIITLSVEPTKRSYTEIPALRMRLWGSVRLPASCTLTAATYRIDSGAGSPRTGPMPVDSKGHFDEQVNALESDEEAPKDTAVFTLTVSAEDEAGSATSNAYTISVQARNPYSPEAP